MAKGFFPGDNYPYDKMVKTEANAYMTVPMVILTVIAVLVGLFAQPFITFFQSIATTIF